MPEVTIYTRDASGVLADTPDLAVVLRVDGTDTSVTVSHEGTGEYVATFNLPSGFAELIASSAARSDAQVIWRTPTSFTSEYAEGIAEYVSDAPDP